MNAPPPQVSVIIPCFRAAETIGLQLASLSDQIDPPPFEVVLVDNDPAGDLESAVERFRSSPAFELRIVPAHEHQGSSYARNVGIAHARSESLLFCDADDVVSQTWVRNGARTTETAALWSGSAIPLAPTYFTHGPGPVRAEIDAPPPSWEAPLDDQRTPFPILMAGNFGARRTTLIELRGFDQSFAHFGDDNDLAFRARRAGHRIPISKCVRIGYRGRTRLRTRLRYAYSAAEAKRVLLARHDAADLSTVLPWHEDLLRTAAASALLPLRRSATVEEILLRWAYALGNTRGSFRRGPADAPRDLLGAGLPQAVVGRNPTSKEDGT